MMVARMNVSFPRPIAFETPPTPQMADGSVYAPRDQEAERRPQPIEAVEADKRVRRDPPEATVRRILADTANAAQQAANEKNFAVVGLETRTVRQGPFGWLGLDSTPFMAQIVGQNPTPRDPVAAGRSPTSFRHSPVDRYEEVQSWGRRVELMFVFDNMVSAAAA